MLDQRESVAVRPIQDRSRDWEFFVHVTEKCVISRCQHNSRCRWLRETSHVTSRYGLREDIRIDVGDPLPGFTAIFFLEHSSKEVDAYDAYTFNGISWTRLFPGRTVEVVDRGRYRMFVAHRWIEVWLDKTFDEADVLDYWSGFYSVADILAIESYRFSRKVIREALELARTLKGAVNSPTAASIVEKLQVALGER